MPILDQIQLGFQPVEMFFLAFEDVQLAAYVVVGLLAIRDGFAEQQQASVPNRIPAFLCVLPNLEPAEVLEVRQSSRKRIRSIKDRRASSSMDS